MRGGRIFAYGAGFAIDESSSIRRIFQDLQNGSHGGFFPDHIAKAISSRQAEVVGIEKLQHEAFGSDPQKRGEDELNAIVDLTVGIFVHLADGITYQSDRKRQRQLTSLSFVE